LRRGHDLVMAAPGTPEGPRRSLQRAGLQPAALSPIVWGRRRPGEAPPKPGRSGLPGGRPRVSKTLVGWCAGDGLRLCLPLLYFGLQDGASERTRCKGFSGTRMGDGPHTAARTATPKTVARLPAIRSGVAKTREEGRFESSIRREPGRVFLRPLCLPLSEPAIRSAARVLPPLRAGDGKARRDFQGARSRGTARLRAPPASRTVFGASDGADIV